MNTYLVSVLVFATLMTISLTTVSAQTFQYSRGWTNGKRNGINPNALYDGNLVERIISNPCQLEKLRYILQGKPLNEKIMVPCDLLNMGSSDSDAEAPALRLKRSAAPYEARGFDNHPGLV